MPLMLFLTLSTLSEVLNPLLLIPVLTLMPKVSSKTLVPSILISHKTGLDIGTVLPTLTMNPTLADHKFL
jgi:hypothetical protein